MTATFDIALDTSRVMWLISESTRVMDDPRCPGDVVDRFIAKIEELGSNVFELHWQDGKLIAQPTDVYLNLVADLVISIGV